MEMAKNHHYVNILYQIIVRHILDLIIQTSRHRLLLMQKFRATFDRLWISINRTQLYFLCTYLRLILKNSSFQKI